MADQSDPSQPSSGFWGGLMSGLTNAPANPLYNMGLGLMSAAKPFGNVGDSLMQANQATIANRGAMQQQAINKYQLQKMQEMMPLYQKVLQSASSGFGSQAPGQIPSSSTPTGPTAPPNRYDPLPPLPMMGGNSFNQINSGTALQLIPGMEKAGEAMMNAPAKQQALLEGIYKQRQQQTAAPLADLDTIMTSDNAAARLAKDQDAFSKWQQENPGAQPTDPQARAFAGTLYNRLAGSAQSPVKPIPTMLQNVPGGQVEATTGKFTGVPTSKFIQNGQVVELPTSDGISKKLTPYDPTLLGSQMISPAAFEQAYQLAKQKGDLTESLAGRDPIAAAKVSSYIAQRAQQEGVSGLAMAAKAQSYKAQQGVVDDFTSGATAKNINGLNTSVQHLTYLGPLIDKLGGSNLTLLNQAANAYKERTGVPAPTNFAALKEFVGGEVARAVLPGGGGEAERRSLTDPLNAANSPTQLKEAVTTIQQALAGKTLALKNQWDMGTSGSQGSFDKFLLPETIKAINQEGTSTGAHPPKIQALIDKYTKKKANGGS
jgi:hypothetical protein